MLYPAVKIGDNVIGVDMHAMIVPLPPPAFPIHPYIGPIYLWHTPKFPMANVFINGLPACGVGAMGYFAHVPQGAPVPPTVPDMPYWKRYLMNVGMGFTLVTLTTFASVAIGLISALIPKPGPADRFVKDVTGIDTTNTATLLSSISASFSALTQWQTWVKLLIPPIPYPGAQGSTAMGSPNVTVNGAPLAFAGPLVGTSCSDIPVMPNASVLGFSNVMVGVSITDLLMGIAASSAKAAMTYGIQRGIQRTFPQDGRQGGRGSGCPPR